MIEPARVVNLFGEQQEAPTDEDLIFEQFWKIYPRHVGKADARKKFHNAMKRATGGELLAAVTLFATNPESVPGKPDSIPHASTWLNQERYKDDLTPAPVRPTVGARIPPSTPEHGPNWAEDPDVLAQNLAALRAARMTMTPDDKENS